MIAERFFNVFPSVEEKLHHCTAGRQWAADRDCEVIVGAVDGTKN
jgi:hypothetical protein